MPLPAPVQWIGWWFTTPLEQCLAWNQTRERQVDAEVIQRMHGFLHGVPLVPDLSPAKPQDGDSTRRDATRAKQPRQSLLRKSRPAKEEGFAFLAELNPTEIPDLSAHCRKVLGGIDRGIQAARNRRQSLVPHRYSRLLDLERLLFLIRLLLEFPGVEFYAASGDPPRQLTEEVAQLRRSFKFQAEAPLPDPQQATFAVRAAFTLARRHGPCYGEVEAVAADLDWLQQQGFTSAFTEVRAVDPGPATAQVRAALETDAGLPPTADRSIFQRQLGLLRYLIQNPFEAPDEDNTVDPNLRLMGRRIIQGRQAKAESKGDTPAQETPGTKPRKRAKRPSSSLRLFLLERLQQIEGVDYSQRRKPYRSRQAGGSTAVSNSGAGQNDTQPQISILDKDIEFLITGYKFRHLLSNHSISEQSPQDHVSL
jgi:hypothetical protein